MKAWVLTMCVLFSLPLSVKAGVSKEDIQKLVENRISEPLILAFIRVNGPMGELSSTDLVELKRMGASDSIVLALLDSSAPRSESSPRSDRNRREPPPPPRDTVCVDRVSESSCDSSSSVIYRTLPQLRIRGNRSRYRRHCR